LVCRPFSSLFNFQTAESVSALAFSRARILISFPRFYWRELGNPKARYNPRGRSAAWRNRLSVASLLRRALRSAPAGDFCPRGRNFRRMGNPSANAHAFAPVIDGAFPRRPDRTSSLTKADPHSGAGRLPWASRTHMPVCMHAQAPFPTHAAGPDPVASLGERG
jgi:hypothetical protein